jgi:hypothetical protein
MALMSLQEQSIGSSLQLKEAGLNAPNMKGAMTFSQTTLTIMTIISVAALSITTFGIT